MNLERIAGPWVFGDDYAARVQTLASSARDRAIVDAYRRDGFVVLDDIDLTDGLDTESMWETLGPIIAAEGQGRAQDAWRDVAAVRAIAVHEEVLRVLRLLYDREPVPFQTLNFLHGTEQPTHSDFIHFSTLPSGYMCGVWTALEDITLAQGPLHYFSGSHTLPEFTYDALGVPRVPAPYDWTNPHTRASYHAYEQAIAGLARESGFHKHELPIKRGRALIWSANLLHGGSPRTHPTATRKSQVTHYFFENTLGITPMFSRPEAGEYLVREVVDIRSAQTRPRRIDGAAALLRDAESGLSRIRTITSPVGLAGWRAVEWAEEMAFRARRKAVYLATGTTIERR